MAEAACRLAEAAKTTTQMLKNVVVEGTGKAAAVTGYEVAGKTGTAQVALKDGLGYAEGTYIASFIGYLPADDAQVLISVKIDEPTNAIYGGIVAAPLFAMLGQFSVEHLKIPPTTRESGSDDDGRTRSNQGPRAVNCVVESAAGRAEVPMTEAHMTTLLREVGATPLGASTCHVGHRLPVGRSAHRAMHSSVFADSHTTVMTLPQTRSARRGCARRRATSCRLSTCRSSSCRFARSRLRTLPLSSMGTPAVV